MPSLFHKSDKTKAAQLPPWHVNFRNYSALPDTKMVRTAFYVNGALALFAVIVLLAFVYQELNISELSTQLGNVEQQLTRSAGPNSKAIELFKQFQAEEQKLSELDSFLKSQKVVLSDSMIRLTQTKPASIVFINITYNSTGITIKGFAQGTPEQATSFASAYEKQLKEDAVFKAAFKSISMTNVSRDTQAARLLFDIVMAFSQPKGK